MNGMTFNSSAPWEELAERLKTENVIIAGDLANIDILYLLTLGASLQAGNRGSAAKDNTTAVPESSSSTATTKKTKETYHLIVNERKGHGGFGVVYRVTKTHPVSKASLEICLKQARTQAWDSLVHENEIFNVLHDHPNDYIIRRDFMCKSDSDCFLGLEYFDGRTLSDIITINSYKKWKISHKDLVLILQQQTAAIDHLQKNGIFHCDIKPENIIYHRGRQLSKLIDFGLAVTRTGLGERFKSQGGTTEYMAPETLVDACLERGSDLYGLAATLHHVITLRCPWYSLEGVQAIRDEKIDRKDPNYDVLSRKRRARIRDCIKFDINRYRGEAAEAEAEKQDIPAMAVQQELWGHEGTCEPQVKYIICLMLHHTPTHRPDCADILSELKSTVNPDIHVQRHISNQPTSSNDDSRGVDNGEQSSSTRSSQPSHPHPVVLNYTDLQKSDQSNLAVDVRQPSERSLSSLMENTSIQEEPAFSQLLVQSSSQMQQPAERMSRVSAPRFSQLMSTSSVQGPALSQLMGRSSQMQQPSEYMSGHISYPTTDMMSALESGPQPVEDKYRDEFSDFDHSISDLVDYVEESSTYYQSYHHYEPDPNQPTAEWLAQYPVESEDFLSQEAIAKPGGKLLDLKRELNQKDDELKEQKQMQMQYTVRLTEFEEITSQLTQALQDANEALAAGRLQTENLVEKNKKLQREKFQEAEALEEANKVVADGRKQIEQLVKKIAQLEKDKYQPSLGFTEMISDMGEQKRMMEREANQRAEAETIDDLPVGDFEQAKQVLVESDTLSAAIQLDVEHRALMDSKDEDSTRLTAQSNLKQHNGDVVTDGNEPDSAIESYVVIPAQLTEKIKKMCHDLAFKDCQIIQDPYIWHDVLVVAVEATSKLSGPLNDLLKTDKEFEKFNIKPFDYEGDSESEQLGDWQCTFTLDRKTVATGSAICELVVQTSTEPQKVFAVGPAHVMFCNEANEKFQSDECKIEEIRKEIESVSPKRIITMKSAHGFDEMEVHQIPWIGYRYQYKQQPPVTKQHKLYTNDCVLFQFDLSIANQVQKELSDAKLTRHEELREVETISSLQTDHSLRQRIAVQGFTGLLFHCVSIDEQIERRKGLHLTFVLTSKDEEGKYHTLSPGDSGSIVYFIGEKQDGKERHQPWGMLVERFRITGFPYLAYRAVVLNQVFRDIEDDYKLRPGEIKLFSSPEQGAASATINESPHCATKAGPMPPCLARLKVEQTNSPEPVPSHSHLSTG